MKKRTILLLVSLLLISCGSEEISSSFLSSSLETSTSFKSNEENTTSSISSLTPSTTPNVEPSTSNIFSSLSSSSLSSSIEEITYNPDGSKHQPIPENKEKVAWGENETTYSFVDSFPDGFRYIYGHQILTNPAFYAKGGWKITVPNNQARMGFQSPRFTSNLKLEIRLYFTEINNSNNKVDEDSPWIRVYGFNDEGKLTQVKEVECPNQFANYANNKNPFNFYMSGEDVTYIELRFVAPPYKGSQCYNFGIKEIGFKTFPYALDD